MFDCKFFFNFSNRLNLRQILQNIYIRFKLECRKSKLISNLESIYEIIIIYITYDVSDKTFYPTRSTLELCTQIFQTRFNMLKINIQSDSNQSIFVLIKKKGK